jgi:hypothetical protein
MKPSEIEALVAELMTRTTWPNVGLPAASTFFTEPCDLKIIQPYYGWDFEGEQKLIVRHRACRGEVKFDLNEQDPIMSEYSCDGYLQDGYVYCDWRWRLHVVQQLTLQDVRHHFYTELVEKVEDLNDWPIKLTEAQTRGLRYSTTRPCTKDEVLRSRVKRLLEIRGVK